MEYLNRESRDVPFGWFELVRAAIASARPMPRKAPLRLPAPTGTLAHPQAR